jgi:WD40 repeat protein
MMICPARYHVLIPRLLFLRTGRLSLLLTLESNSAVSVSVSSGGKQLASASWDKTVKLLDASSVALLHPFKVNPVIETLSFSNDGTVL